MKRSIFATALAAVFASVLFAPAPAAQAGGCTFGVVCGVIKHYTPDSDYDPAILIRCDYGDAATGWHKINNAFNDGAGCTLRKD